MSRKRKKIGDIIEINVYNRFAYAQLLGCDTYCLDFVRIMKGIYNNRLDMNDIVNLDEQFQTFVSLNVELSKSLVYFSSTIIGHFAIPEKYKTLPLLKFYSLWKGEGWCLKLLNEQVFPENERNYYNVLGNLIDNVKVIGETLPSQYEDCPLYELISPYALRSMIIAGATNSNLFHLLKENSLKDDDTIYKEIIKNLG
jgi:hypothetical protein